MQTAALRILAIFLTKAAFVTATTVFPAPESPQMAPDMNMPVKQWKTFAIMPIATESPQIAPNMNVPVKEWSAFPIVPTVTELPTAAGSPTATANVTNINETQLARSDALSRLTTPPASFTPAQMVAIQARQFHISHLLSMILRSHPCEMADPSSKWAKLQPFLKCIATLPSNVHKLVGTTVDLALVSKKPMEMTGQELKALTLRLRDLKFWANYAVILAPRNDTTLKEYFTFSYYMTNCYFINK